MYNIIANEKTILEKGIMSKETATNARADMYSKTILIKFNMAYNFDLSKFRETKGKQLLKYRKQLSLINTETNNTKLYKALRYFEDGQSNLVVELEELV